MATFLKRSNASPEGEAARRAVQEAGFGVLEIREWSEASSQLDGAAAVVCAGSADEALRIARSLTRQALSQDAARSLSHDLRTPLTAMAGWVHLLETGKLDQAGVNRVVDKLRNNIDDQVRTIDKYLGSTTQKDMAE
jgi:signal transduction histidine kinase